MLLLLEHQDCEKNIRRGTNSPGSVRGTTVLCAQQQCLSCCIWVYIFNISVPQHPTLNIQCSFLALLSSYFPFQTPFSWNPPTIQPLQCSVSTARKEPNPPLGSVSHYCKCTVAAAGHPQVKRSTQRPLYSAFL